MNETLLRMHPTHTFPQIAAAIFNDPYKAPVVCTKARRLGLKKMHIVAHSIDNAKFSMLWARGAGITHIAHVFKCSSDYARIHARKLGLPERGKYV